MLKNLGFPLALSLVSSNCLAEVGPFDLLRGIGARLLYIDVEDFNNNFQAIKTERTTTTVQGILNLEGNNYRFPCYRLASSAIYNCQPFEHGDKTYYVKIEWMDALVFEKAKDGEGLEGVVRTLPGASRPNFPKLNQAQIDELFPRYQEIKSL